MEAAWTRHSKSRRGASPVRRCWWTVCGDWSICAWQERAIADSGSPTPVNVASRHPHHNSRHPNHRCRNGTPSTSGRAGVQNQKYIFSAEKNVLAPARRAVRQVEGFAGIRDEWGRYTGLGRKTFPAARDRPTITNNLLSRKVQNDVLLASQNRHDQLAAIVDFAVVRWRGWHTAIRSKWCRKGEHLQRTAAVLGTIQSIPVQANRFPLRSDQAALFAQGST